MLSFKWNRNISEKGTASFLANMTMFEVLGSNNSDGSAEKNMYDVAFLQESWLFRK